MRSVFDKISSHTLLKALIYILLGILMFIFPKTIVSIIVYVLAAYVAVLGVINIINFIRNRDENTSMSFDLVSGILMIVLAIIMLVFKEQLLGILSIFLGVLLILNAATNLAQIIGYGKIAKKQNIFLIILDILVIIGGLVIIFKPFSTTLLMLQIFGIIIIVNGIGELIAYFTYKNISNEVKE